MFRATQKTLTEKEDLIELFTFLKTNNLIATSKNFGLTYDQVKYQRNKYRAFDNEELDRTIRQIQREIDGFHRDAEKQLNCDHKNAKVFLKCDCSLCLSELNATQIIEILEKIRSVTDKKIIEQILCVEVDLREKQPSQ